MLNKLLFLDLETTGLDPNDNSILEVGAAVVDKDLKVLAEFEQVVKASDETLSLMDEWCIKTHKASGLISAVKEQGKPLEEVEANLINFVKEQYGEAAKGKIILAGNTISFDRNFINVNMPKFARWLHYRSVDVSSFAIVIEMQYGMKKDYKNSNVHRSMADVKESIDSLKQYMRYLTKEGD